ncbi:Pentatricopeptide repeat-containing protein At2g31400 [Durusdinium trenchii]|uniref:Chloroplastic n=1 Tax=Durusdinium trenchii TaxID=1381693 RepID=A0ABP0HJN9_9DINO
MPWSRCLAPVLPSLSRRSRCEEPSDSEPPTQRPPRVVVVGAGLTGCLTAALLRRSLPQLELQVWERATYPSGRFGAGLAFEGHWLDLGAQVLSLIEVDSGHPNAGADGHNLQSSDLCSAWEEVQKMVSQSFLHRVPDDMLAATEERMKYTGLWAHFWCHQGFGALQRRYLAEARAELRHGRVDAVADGTLVITKRPSGQVLREEADLVILAVPAPEVLRVTGPGRWPAVAAALERIRYDRRSAVGVALDHALLLPVADAFAGAAEMSLDLPQYVEADDKVHLIAWQNVKRMECHGVSSTSIPHGDPILLVVHSTTSEPNFHLSDALKAVSQVLGVPSSLVEGLVLKSKMVDWTSCQMVQPLESIPTNLRVEEPCLQHGRVIVVLRWNLALATAAKSAKWKRALSLMQGLRTEALQPDVVTFNTLLRACTRASRWKLGLFMLDSMREQELKADAVTFTSLLGFQKDAAAWIRAVAILHAMQLALLQPDGHALNAVLAECMAAGHWTLGLILLKQVQSAQLASRKPDKQHAVALSTVMAGAVRAGRWDVALSLFGACEALDRVDGVLLSTCMRVCRAGHFWQLGLLLLPRAQDPDAAVYNAAISMCADAGQWQTALGLFGEAHRNQRTDTTSCNAAITACDRGRAWPHALYTFHLAVGLRDYISYCAIFSACRGQWPLTLALLRMAASEQIQPGERAWSALLTSCNSQWELGLVLADEGAQAEYR